MSQVSVCIEWLMMGTLRRADRIKQYLHRAGEKTFFILLYRVNRLQRHDDYGDLNRMVLSDYSYIWIGAEKRNQAPLCKHPLGR